MTLPFNTLFPYPFVPHDGWTLTADSTYRRGARTMTRRDKPRGQAMVEFALVIPVFILLLVGMFDLGRVVWVNDTLATAAREAARYAIVHGEKLSCPVGPPAAGAVIPTADASCPYPSPSRQGSRTSPTSGRPARAPTSPSPSAMAS